jgi:phosphoglycerate kinase
MINKQTIHDIDVRNKRVLVRVDFNVPLDAQKRVADDTRIKGALPTIDYLLEQGASVILLSHLGRPKGRVVETLRLAPVALRLSELLGQPVQTATDCIGPEVERLARSLQPGQVLLLENLRFHQEEEQNDRMFARQLAALGEIYVNDAFGTAHRAHASTESIAHELPAVAGLLMEKELFFLRSVMEMPKRPFAAIIGGAKVSDKLAVLDHLIDLVDVLLIGGGMANTFLKAQGYEVGESLVEDDQLERARAVLAKARQRALPVLLPADVVVANRFSADARAQLVSIDQVPQGWCVMDIGSRTVETFRQALADARLIFWNGTLGVAEMPAFACGTQALIAILAERTQQGATTIIGGGDSTAAVVQAGAASNMTYLSTGGGASLEFLEGRVLPGVEVLQEKVYPTITHCIAHR